MTDGEYLLAAQPSERERLQLQSLVWEPSGRQLLTTLGEGSGLRALDVGYGALGSLRILSERKGDVADRRGDLTEAVFSRVPSALPHPGLPAVGESCGSRDRRAWRAQLSSTCT